MVDAKEFIGRGGRDDAARFEQDDARREAAGFAEVVGYEHDGLAEASSDVRELALHFGTCNRIESAEWLVHQKYGRIGGQSACDADALTLSTGELIGTTIREL